MREMMFLVLSNLLKLLYLWRITKAASIPNKRSEKYCLSNVCRTFVGRLSNV